MRTQAKVLLAGIVVFASPLGPVPGVAQDKYGTGGRYVQPHVSVVVQEHLQDRGRIRLLLFSGRKLDVRESMVQPAGVQSAGAADVIPWNDVRGVQIKTNSAWQGAQVGGLLLGAAGLVAGLSMAGECSGGALSFELCGASAADVMLVTAVGLGAGMVLGGVIGAAIPRWETVYQRSGQSIVGFRPIIEPGRRGFGAMMRIHLGSGAGR
jgi:hypothetical protein